MVYAQQPVVINECEWMFVSIYDLVMDWIIAQHVRHPQPNDCYNQLEPTAPT